MPCSTADCDNTKVFARGLCQPCYYRLRRNGSVQRKNLRKSAHCTAPDCTAPVLGKNLCLKHYRAQQHELNAVWKLLRSRNKGEYPVEWERFEAFLADVGERPGPHHKLKRLDDAQPYAKANMHWKPPLPKAAGKDRKAYHAAFGREWNLRSRFGIDGDGYARMLSEQGDACAICRQPETSIHHRTGEPRSLAVDHDHETGVVRGLLCRDCNTGIGLFDDDLETLRSAIAYLERHQA